MGEEPAGKRLRGKVRGSASGRPIMAALDLFGRRWSLRILWELRNGPRTSRALREACGGASPSVLQQRLDELRAAGLVALEPGEGYGLTALGRELELAMQPLLAWSARWAKTRPNP